MLSFESDYIHGAHPRILERLAETNMEALSGYGADKYCQSAAEKIRVACGCPDAEVHFLVGGTQTNAIVISAMLHPYEGVIAAETGHVSVHEAGAIEYTGHKVLTLPGHEGKLDAAEVAQYFESFYADENHEHAVFPGMVYISHPTEYGTLYSRDELIALSEACHAHGAALYMDGARLGYGLAGEGTDVTLADIAAFCDAFYIGGTKVGALCGEAVVFTGQRKPSHFMTLVKQHGALLAKGRLLGVQFDTLFTDDLYLSLGRHAIRAAVRLKEILRCKGYSFFLETPTNQQFIVLTDEQLATLREQVSLSFWERLDANRVVVRFATSWSTTDADIEAVERIL